MTRRRRTVPTVALVALAATLASLAGVGAGATASTDATAGPGAPVSASGDANPAAPAGLHGNHVGVDAQVVADGEVVVESLFTIEDAYLVIRADDGGDLGEPIGHVALDGGYQRSVAVDTDASFWADRKGPVQLYAAIHRDADPDDGAFDPAEDTLLQSPATGTAVDAFRARRGDAAHVLAQRFEPQSTVEPRVRLGRVSLPADGAVVIHAATADLEVGERVGERSLSAGSHDGVAVPLDESFFEGLGENGSARLWATVTVDGEAVTVGDEPVRTLFSVEVGNGSEDEWAINTPAPTPTAAPTTAQATDTDGGASDDSYGAPGFTAVAALATLAAAVALRRRR